MGVLMQRKKKRNCTLYYTPRQAITRIKWLNHSDLRIDVHSVQTGLISLEFFSALIKMKTEQIHSNVWG